MCQKKVGLGEEHQEKGQEALGGVAGCRVHGAGIETYSERRCLIWKKEAVCSLVACHRSSVVGCSRGAAVVQIASPVCCS